MTKIKQPKIRFKGHINGWEERKLKNVSTFKQGIQVDLERQYQIQNDNLIRFIRIVDYTQNTQDIRYIDINTSKNIIQPDDIIMVRYGATAGFIGRGIEGILANNMFSINPTQKIVKDYLYIYLRQDKIYKQLNNSNGSSAMPAINFSLVGNLNITYPKLEEQKKIGEFFKTLDETIALHQQKLEVTKQFKQTMLKKMFPKNGETTPEIRFKGFTDDWEDDKFLNIFNKYSEKNINSFEQYTIGKKGVKKIEKDILYAVENHKLFKPNSLILGLGIEEMGVSEDIFGSCSPIYTTYNIKQANTLFIKYFINGFLNINKNKVTKTSTRREFEIVIRDVEKLNLRLPNSQEQELIGNYFKELDNQINYLEQKLEKYKEFKKAMLQKMFI